MGIPQLWQIVKPAATNELLFDYCLDQTTFQKTESGGLSVEPIVIGIDASIWMNECQAVFHSPRHAQMGENPELRTLFYRLASLLRLCVIPVFIFDGPGRPLQKRGKKVLPKEHWLTMRFKEFIDAFGFFSHNAPGEAEAELAHFNKIGLIDAVDSQDSDALVFGATCVFRSNGNIKKNAVNIYKASEIQVSPSVALTEGGLLLFALLNGGDYDSGLEGCGSAIAHGLAQAGLGDSLLDAVRALTRCHLEEFLVTWRNNLRTQLRSDPGGFLRQRYAKLSSRISDQFPNVDIIYLYARPLVSPLGAVNRSRWVVHNINIRQLVQLCNRCFSWSTLDIGKTFINVVWDGVAFRQLLQFAAYGIDDDALLPPKLFRRARRLPLYSIYSVAVNIRILTEGFPMFIDDPQHQSRSHEFKSLTQVVHMRAPHILIEQYLPHVFEKKSRKSGDKRANNSTKSRCAGKKKLDVAGPRHNSHVIIDLTSD